ncbi:MAG TPA: hypothetical protein VMJ93_06645 [Verrucomicrobiae bacterium]|nr:hypothetical protein [Verrucomicrobiae bacterium]
MKSALGFLALFFSLALPLRAQQPPQPSARQDAFLDRMTGHWVLSGTIAGRQTIHDVDAGWVLNREYLRLHEVSREKSPAGSPAYEAIVFIGWDPEAREYTILWLDTTSGAGLNSPVIGRGTLSGDQILFLFKSAEGNFHTTFA